MNVLILKKARHAVSQFSESAYFVVINWMFSTIYTNLQYSLNLIGYPAFIMFFKIKSLKDPSPFLTLFH